ncbi:MAG: nicotinate-nucleotide--dimethylbenzimidazole phosphoribosyltransferase [Anaerovoracaceae bacterium]|jgi:nicotinate-nucleotide--dimethylbenzimidazole phosphoribosyltransferase
MEKQIREMIGKIQPLDEEVMKEARDRQGSLAKPPGSLGRLEDISVQIAGITGRVINEIEKKCVVVLSADNGVVEEGISSAPKSVTTAQTINFIRRLTGVGVLAKNTGSDLLVVDMGIDCDLPQNLISEDPRDFVNDKIIHRKLGYGTGNLSKGPAMTREQAVRALLIGMELARETKEMGYDILGVGEMGIGNTTTSAAVLSALTGCPAEAVVGRGGGINDASFERKKAIVDKAAHQEFTDHVDVLAKVGGFDLAAMTGVFIGAAAEKMPIVVDGYISAVSALLAEKIAPGSKAYMLASHESFEIGYRKAMEALGLVPMMHLGMRLGEGSGCPLAFLVIEQALGVMRDMATFREAEINDDYLEEIRKGNCF